MGWKVIHLTKPCNIKIKNENIVLSFYKTQEKVKLVIKDIDFILFDNTKFSITGKAIELLAKNNIATLFINDKFHPSAILLPYHKHSTMSEIANTQINLTKSFKEKVWRDIIKCKITNQAQVLEYFDNKKYIKLKDIASKVKLYDKNNAEAISARIYWKNIFDDKYFKRDKDGLDILNSILNYTYAILRASMARSISASGLLPIFGIWHKNKYNAFNLVDDLIEPFRAICDIYIKILFFKKHKNKTSLDVELKQEITALLGCKCVNMNSGEMLLNKSIEQFVINYKKAMILGNEAQIIYPSINVSFFKNELI